MKIGIAGAGAFGTALAVALARDTNDIVLWARNIATVDQINTARRNDKLPDVPIPDSIAAVADLDDLFACDTILLAIPAQTLPAFLTAHRDALGGKYLVACCKGIDLTRMTGPATTIRDLVPDAVPAILTGPSFAADIARGLPTALRTRLKRRMMPLT